MTWEPGDMALCIKSGPWKAKGPKGETVEINGPKCGQMFLVVDVIEGLVGMEVETFLVFQEFTRSMYKSDSFIKVTPDEDFVKDELERDNQITTDPFDAPGTPTRELEFN